MSNGEKVEKIVAVDQMEGEEELEGNLRPRQLGEYIGQGHVKKNLGVFMTAAQKRGEPLDHILIYGPPGLGKTTLAHVIAHETGHNIRATSGPAIERPGDLAAILTNLQDGDILFIDEIHRLNRLVEEVLYPAMEDYVLDLVIGKGPSARTLRLDLPKFTLIGATTRMSLISSPMRDRFGLVLSLEFYEDGDIAKIIKRSAGILKVEVDNDALSTLSTRSRKTPRIANRILKRVRDFAEVNHNGRVNKEIAEHALNDLDIDKLGLDRTDRKILLTLAEKFGGGPVGLGTLAAATAEETETVEEVYEPFLLQIGFLERTPRGRKITSRALEHLKINLKNDSQKTLFER
jgi:Holliday junction DNA helicase RuvB